MPSINGPPSRPAVIKQLIEGVDRYNPDNCQILEDYLTAQCQNGENDLMANLAILKLYQFNPEQANINVVNSILGKALTAVPEPDFNTCLYMLGDAMMTNEYVVKLIEMQQLIESAEYRKFWTMMEKDELAMEAVSEITGFEDAVRGVIAKAVNMTCQSIAKHYLEEYLNLSGGKLEEFIIQQNWKSENDRVSIPINKDNEAKTTLLTESIKFEQLTKIIGYSATNI